MPRYDYECEGCSRTFEVRQRISEAPLTSCPSCGGPVRRLISAAPFILKGGGWYVTDYPSAARKKGMESEKKASAPAESAPAAATATPAGSTAASTSGTTTAPATAPGSAAGSRSGNSSGTASGNSTAAKP